MAFNPNGPPIVRAAEAADSLEKRLEKYTPNERDLIVARFREVESIGRAVGGDYAMPVHIGKPGGGSFYNNGSKEMTLDPEHLLKKGNFPLYVSGHEGAHRAITVGAQDFGYPMREVKELYSQAGFGYMHNIIEDCAINDWVEGRFIGFEELVKEMYDGQFAKQNTVMSTPEVNQIMQRIGFQPRFAHMGSEIMRRWHTGEYSEKLDPDVRAALDASFDHAERAYSDIPNPQVRDRGEIVATAKNRFEIANEHVWPEMQKLIEKDMEDAASMNSAVDMLKKDQKRREKQEKHDGLPDGDPEKDKLKKEIDDLKKDLKSFDQIDEGLKEALREIIDTLKKLFEEQQEGGDQGDPGGGGGVNGSPDGGGESASGAEDSQGGGSAGEGGQGDAPGTSEIDFKPGSGENGRPLTEEESKKFKEFFEKLSPEEQAKYRQEGKQGIENLEDTINAKIRGQLDETPETHGERRAREAKEEEDAKEADDEAKRQRQQQEELERQRLQNMTGYEKLLMEARPMSAFLYRRLMSVLHPEQEGAEITGLPRGDRIDINRVSQAEADFNQKLKLWVKDVRPDIKDYAFQFCMDRSFSVSDILEAQKIGLISVSDALNKLEKHNDDHVNIRHSISSFGDEHYGDAKGFRQRFTKNVGEEIAAWDAPGTTDTAGAVKEELDRAFKEGANTGSFIFIFTDGEPDDEDALREILAETAAKRKRLRVHVGLIWIGDEGLSQEEMEEAAGQLEAHYGFDFSLGMADVNASQGGEHFGQRVSRILQRIVQSTVN